MQRLMSPNKYLSQRTTKPTIRLVQPPKTQISLHIGAVWSEYSLITFAFFSLWTIQRRINGNLWQTGWMYRLICIFTGLLVDFVMRFSIIMFKTWTWFGIHHYTKEILYDCCILKCDSNLFSNVYQSFTPYLYVLMFYVLRLLHFQAWFNLFSYFYQSFTLYLYILM